jgi:hypothetical protein
MSTWESPLKDVPKEYAKMGHPVWAEIHEYLSPHEFRFPYEMDVEFLRLLFRIRVDAGVPFRLLSDARDPEGDVGASKSAHKRRPCRAIDLKVYNSYERARVGIAATRAGIVRLGVYPEKKKSLHIDAEDHPDNASPRWWTKY